MKLNVHCAAVLLLVILSGAGLQAQAPTKPTADQPFSIEYYYKVKWGYADEFLQLFKKNHYPLLKKEMESGRILKVWMEEPQLHMTEDARWTYRATIVFKNATVANTANPDEDAILKSLYPDQASYKQQEQRRFELMEAHWDLPVQRLELEGK